MAYAVGELKQHSALGTHALYRVMREDGKHVECEVVHAPGLRPGLRVRLMKATVDAMQTVRPALDVELELQGLRRSAA